ncbi:STAS domain-containing protein [Egicoccus sp. AB-alg2]|uniref:STAS domain-containing protein n=1 Tax=Egicoccus sp. AB-alg2 TaxID=3242693 RepID=UPI00359E8732
MSRTSEAAAMAEPLAVRTAPGDGRDVTLRLSGELDAHTSPLLEHHLEHAVAATDGDVRLEVSELTFVDSSGLGCLLRAAGTLGSLDRRLVLRAPSPPLQRLIELAGVAPHLAVES